MTGSIELKVLTYGGVITSLRVPDRNRHLGNVVLGFQTLEPYVNNRGYLGAIIGRYANRVARGQFCLDGVSHQLTTNEAPNHLHGGDCGFDRRVWAAAPLMGTSAVGVRFTRTSPAGEEGYPGTLDVAVTYLITSESTVTLEYEATTNASTIVNLTQHTYFNLSGGLRSSVLDHELTVHASHYTPVDAALIPTGKVADVNATPFDFRRLARIGDRLMEDHEQLRQAGGFDHNFIVARKGTHLSPVAELRDPVSGRALQIASTEPGVQFYAGQMLNEAGTGGPPFGSHAGLCLETQHFPDSPNHPHFPTVVLKPGETYRSKTTWTFASGERVAV